MAEETAGDGIDPAMMYRPLWEAQIDDTARTIKADTHKRAASIQAAIASQIATIKPQWMRIQDREHESLQAFYNRIVGRTVCPISTSPIYASIGDMPFSGYAGRGKGSPSPPNTP